MDFVVRTPGVVFDVIGIIGGLTSFGLIAALVVSEIRSGNLGKWLSRASAAAPPPTVGPARRRRHEVSIPEIHRISADDSISSAMTDPSDYRNISNYWSDPYRINGTHPVQTHDDHIAGHNPFSDS